MIVIYVKDKHGYFICCMKYAVYQWCDKCNECEWIVPGTVEC